MLFIALGVLVLVGTIWEIVTAARKPRHEREREFRWLGYIGLALAAVGTYWFLRDLHEFDESIIGDTLFIISGALLMAASQASRLAADRRRRGPANMEGPMQGKT